MLSHVLNLLSSFGGTLIDMVEYLNSFEASSILCLNLEFEVTGVAEAQVDSGLNIGQICHSFPNILWRESIIVQNLVSEYPQRRLTGEDVLYYSTVQADKQFFSGLGRLSFTCGSAFIESSAQKWQKSNEKCIRVQRTKSHF